MNAFAGKLILGCIGVIVILSGIIYYQHVAILDTKKELRNRIAMSDVLRDESNGWKSKYAIEVSGKEEVIRDRDFKQTKIDELMKRIKNAKLITASRIDIAGRTGTKGMNVDTVFIASPNPLDFLFSSTVSGIGIAGRVKNPPPEVSLTVTVPEVSFIDLLIQESNGMYRSEVHSSNENDVIKNTETRVVTNAAGDIKPKRSIPVSSNLFVGWTRDQGVFGGVGVNIWISEFGIFAKNKGIDYGGRVNILSKSWR